MANILGGRHSGDKTQHPPFLSSWGGFLLSKYQPRAETQVFKTANGSTC